MSYTPEQLAGMRASEIEVALAERLGINWHLAPNDNRNEKGRWVFLKDNEASIDLPRYCTDWSVTGPLMDEHEVSMIFSPDEDGTVLEVVGLYGAIYSHNPNPLRAVCEVLLQMPELSCN